MFARFYHYVGLFSSTFFTKRVLPVLIIAIAIAIAIDFLILDIIQATIVIVIVIAVVVVVVIIMILEVIQQRDRKGEEIEGKRLAMSLREGLLVPY